VSTSPVSQVGHRRLAVGYAAMAILIAAVSVLAFRAGSGEHAQPVVAGAYHVVPPPCGAESIVVQQSGRYLSVDAAGADVRSAKLVDGTAQVVLECGDGSLVTVALAHAASGARASVRRPAPPSPRHPPRGRHRRRSAPARRLSAGSWRRSRS
jgi:hypothetical protein